MSQEKPQIKNRYWIPTIGWYLNYFELPKTDRDRFWLTVNSLLLIGFILSTFIIPYTAKIPLDIATTITTLLVEIFVLLIIIITFIETTWVTRSKNLHTKRFQKLHWDRFDGKSRRFVLITFLYFNYQEMSIAIIGTILNFMGHALI